VKTRASQATSWVTAAKQRHFQSGTRRVSKQLNARFKLVHYGGPCESECCNISNLQAFFPRATRCKSIGMSLSLILVAVQILVAIFALIRESGEDKRFEGEALEYRS
jgi:hypothetical protein